MVWCLQGGMPPLHDKTPAGVLGRVLSNGGTVAHRCSLLPAAPLLLPAGLFGVGVGLGGGGWDWHDAGLCCCLQLAAPLGLSPLTAALPLNPFPLQAAAPIGLSPPCALPLPAWPTYGKVKGRGGGGGDVHQAITLNSRRGIYNQLQKKKAEGPGDIKPLPTLMGRGLLDSTSLNP